MSVLSEVEEDELEADADSEVSDFCIGCEVDVNPTLSVFRDLPWLPSSSKRREVCKDRRCWYGGVPSLEAVYEGSIIFALLELATVHWELDLAWP